METELLNRSYTAYC